MAQYPYPTSGVKDTRIYKPQQPPRYANVDPDDSSAPLNFSGDSSSRYPADTSSPQPVTSGSSFDDDQTAVKGRRPKKGKKAQQAAAASIDEQQAMVSGSGSKSLLFCTYSYNTYFNVFRYFYFFLFI